MVTIVNLIGQTMTGTATQTRRASLITRVARHHSATASGDVFVFQNHWQSLGWHTGGYHEIILRDGTVQLCYAPTTITNGVANHNHNTYHICVVGNGSFTEAQERSFEERARVAMNSFNLRASQILGHNEFQGAATACPGINMNNIRQRLNQSSIEQNVHTVQSGETLTSIARQHGVTVQAIADVNNLSNPNRISVGQQLMIPTGGETGGGTTNNQTFVVHQAISGFTTADDASHNRNPRITVQPGTYHIFNQVNGMINVTTRQGQPGSWINPAHNTNQNFFPIPNYSGASLVQALNNIKVDSSFANRERIARANGINNYTGTAAQNTQLLNLLRVGRLVRP